MRLNIPRVITVSALLFQAASFCSAVLASERSAVLVASYSSGNTKNFPAPLENFDEPILSPSGQRLHVFGGSFSSTVLSFAVDQSSGRLALTRQALRTGSAPIEAAAASSDGLFAYLATGGEAGGAVDIYSLDDITGAVAYVSTVRDGVGGVSDLQEPRAIVIRGDGAFVYVAASASNSIVVFARDTMTGLLTQVQVVEDGVSGISGIAGAQELAISPDGSSLYVGAAGANGVTAFDVAAPTGLLTFQATYSTVDGHALGRVDGVTISDDGKNVYAYGPFVVGIGVFVRSLLDGSLSDAPWFSAEGLTGPDKLAFSPDGELAFAPSDDVLTLVRDPGNGSLSIRRRERYIGASGDMLRSPDGRFVFGGFGYSAAVFQIVNVQCPAAVTSLGCQAAGPGGSRLSIKRTATKRSLQWRAKLPTGSPLPGGFFGDPLNTTDAALCLYDSNSGGLLRGEAVLPAGNTCPSKACWKTTSTGFSYKDQELTPHGVASAKLSPTKITVSAKGDLLEMGNIGFMTYATPVVAQLRTSDGSCVEATFSVPKVSDGTRFVANSD